MSQQKRKRSESPDNVKTANAPNDQTTIYRSSQIEDRQSTFIGLYSPTLTPKALQQHASIASASHKILGWRRESNQQSLTSAKQFVSGHDDDGEKYGGKKVEMALVTAGVIGACVVARWYGGVMLGPVRFTHMEACAREAVQKWRDSVQEEAAKKRKVEEDKGEAARLVGVLGARDRSITVLRALAVEKEAALEKAKASEADGADSEVVVADATAGLQAEKKTPQKQTSTVTSAPDYASMPLDRLRLLEKARDATLSFLLKRIDKAESGLKVARQSTQSIEEPP